MSINIVEAFSTDNKCYQIGTPLKPRGIMLHSIGCPQPSNVLVTKKRGGFQ